MNGFCKQPAVYILASQRNGTLYIGVTSNLAQRAWQHRTGAIAGFASRHQCKRLVFFELHAMMLEAIGREKQLKGGSRVKKIKLIERDNPTWRDRYEDIRQSPRSSLRAACGSIQRGPPVRGTPLDCLVAMLPAMTRECRTPPPSLRTAGEANQSNRDEANQGKPNEPSRVRASFARAPHWIASSLCSPQ